MANELLPAQDIPAEEYVLGAMMLSSRAIDDVLEVGLDQLDFYRGSHGLIYAALNALYGDGEPTDAVSAVNKLGERGELERVGGSDRIREIASLVPAAANAGHHAKIVREMSILRAVGDCGRAIAQLAADRGMPTPEIVDRAEGLVFDLSRVRRTREYVTAREAVDETYAEVEAAHARGSEMVGLPTGFRTLDAFTAGLAPGNLVVLAARPGMGKSGFATGVAANVAVRQKKPVALFSLEMSQGEVTQRLLSVEARVEATKIRSGQLDAEEWRRFVDAAGRVANAPILIDESATITAMEIRSKARRMKLRHPDLALVIVDYLQLMTSGERLDSRVQDVSMISRALKVLARELEVPVLALSQLSRAPELRHDHRPWLSDLRESGSLEQDADLVLFVYRDEYYNPENTDQQGVAEINIAKHRNGPIGTVKLAFVKRFVLFADMAMGGMPTER